MKSKVPFREKLKKINAEIVEIPEKMQKRFGKGRMLIPSPVEMESLISEIPEGSFMYLDDLRDELARRNHVNVTCPLTSGIFLRMIAEAAEEERGFKKSITPYWRVFKKTGELNPKFPGGLKFLAGLLKNEGFKTVISEDLTKGKVIIPN